jgi:hypothetical protein
MGSSAILNGLPIAEIEQFAQHALTAGVTADAIVDELVKIAQETGALSAVPAPWAALIADVGAPVLKIALRWVVRKVQRKLDATLAPAA